MDFSKLTGSEKAAVLLLCLGEEATAQVFEELSDSEVRLISRNMMSIDYIPKDVAEEVFLAYKKTQQDHAGIFIRGNQSPSTFHLYSKGAKLIY